MIAMLTLLRCDGFSVSTLLPKPGTDRGSGDRLVEKAEPAPVAARGCVATFKKRQESDGSGRAGAVSCNHPEQLVDELNLSPTIRTAHPPRLPLPDHVHGLVALDRSPRRVECTKALLAVTRRLIAR